MIGVAFPFENVLGTSNGLEKTAFLRVASDVTSDHGTEFDASLAGAAVDRELEAVARGTRPLCDGLSRAFSSVCGPHMVGPALLERYRKTATVIAPEFIRPLPQAARTLRELKALGIPHALVTRSADEIERRAAHSIGLRGEIVAASDEAGRWSDEVLRALVAALGVPPGQIFFVGADPHADIDPATRAGMQSVWLTNGERYPAGLRAPAYRIKTIDGLLDVLREPYTRSLLGLRYILHNVAGWRPGHFLRGSEYGRGETTS